MTKVGCLQRLIGLAIIFVGIIMLLIFMADDFTIIGIIDNIIPLAVIGVGVKLAFPGVKLPKLGK